MFGRWSFASVLLILTISQTLPSSGRNFNFEDEEFCEREMFEASCSNSDEVIIIRKALFGRMNLGRCVETGYGKLGCSANALTEVENHCSGRQRCQFPVGSLQQSTRPCPAELMSFLQVSYDCVKVMSCPEYSCSAGKAARVSSREGFLASVVTLTAGCGSESCPWVLPALPGQRFNLTFRSFGRRAMQSEVRTQQLQTLPPLAGRFCQRLAAVVELSSQVSKDVTLCDSDVTEVRLVTSANDEVTLKLYYGTPENPAYFVVRYEVIGCPDPEIPHGAVMKRAGNLATVSCHGKSSTAWHLTCNGVSWSGKSESCVNPPSHHDVAIDWSVKAAMEQAGSTTEGILVVVGLGVIIGILVGCFLLAVVVILIRRRRRKQMLRCERRLELLTHISPDVVTSEQHAKFHEQKPPSSGAPPCDFHQVAQSLIYSDSGFGTYGAHGCPPPPPRSDEVSTTNLALLQNTKMASDAISYAVQEEHHMYESRTLSTQA